MAVLAVGTLACALRTGRAIRTGARWRGFLYDGTEWISGSNGCWFGRPEQCDGSRGDTKQVNTVVCRPDFFRSGNGK